MLFALAFFEINNLIASYGGYMIFPDKRENYIVAAGDNARNPNKAFFSFIMITREKFQQAWIYMKIPAFKPG